VRRIEQRGKRDEAGAWLILLPILRVSSSHFVKFLFLLSLHGHAVASIGLLLGCLIHVPIIAVMLCPLTVIPFMLTSGFFINNTTMPRYLEWLAVLSPHRYFFEGAMGLEFRDLKLHCDESEISTILLAPTSNAPQSFRYCSTNNGGVILDLLSLPADSYWSDVGALIAICVCFRFAAYLVLAASVRENRLKLTAYRRRLVKSTLALAAAVMSTFTTAIGRIRG
jgi:ABC-type multidrug transport system permease subunit